MTPRGPVDVYDGRALVFLFHCHRDIGVRREPNLVALHTGNQAFVYEV